MRPVKYSTVKPKVVTKAARQGAALVEFFVMLPVVMTLVFGAIDVGRAMKVQNTLTAAARAGGRLYAVKDEISETQVRNVVSRVMSNSNIRRYNLKLDPRPSVKVKHLDPVTVTVTVPYDQVSWIPSWFLKGQTLSGSFVMPADTGEIPKKTEKPKDPPSDKPPIVVRPPIKPPVPPVVKPPKTAPKPTGKPKAAPKPTGKPSSKPRATP